MTSRTIILLLLLFSTSLSAQVLIKDQDTGETIPFVHIFDSDGYLGAVSDINGQIAQEDILRLTQSAESILNIQHIAYETREIIPSVLADSKEILLTERSLALDEIIVTPQIDSYDYVRLRTFFRSYVLQDNEPLYYVDGIVSYYIPRKKGKTRIALEQHRIFHNKQLDAKNRLNNFFVNVSNKPGLPEQIDALSELNRKYNLRNYENGQYIVRKDSIVGYVHRKAETGQAIAHIDRLAPDSVKSFKLGSLRIEKNRGYGSTQYTSSCEKNSLGAKDIISAKEFYSTQFAHIKKELSVEIETLKEIYVLDKSFIMKDDVSKIEFVKSHRIPAISSYQTEYWNELHQRNIPPIDLNFEKRLGELLILE